MRHEILFRLFATFRKRLLTSSFLSTWKETAQIMDFHEILCGYIFRKSLNIIQVSINPLVPNDVYIYIYLEGRGVYKVLV